ncbi:MAG: Fic family protein [Fibrobacter sp.]|jgi:fido (protein-threonine AMPylation protein)|nr:Fic family protein [Fibrobacter sp.]
MTDFEEYIRQSEPDKKEKGIIWQTAIGLQQVDGLKPSAYLIETAKQNIEGDITFDEVKSRIDAYYKTQFVRWVKDDNDRTEEADKVSARIAEILSEKTFSFSPTEYLNIHRRLFCGIYKFAGKIRDYNITKSEWVLNGETVLYASADNLKETLEYDFEQEKTFNYKGLSQQQIIEHIAHFTAYLWQIHIFGEGNTRTTAVFLIKYLRKLGFKDINNETFAKHSWYFRNALVRANYENIAQGIYRTEKYLVRFLSNILLGENNSLKNREMHIHFVEPVNAVELAFNNSGVGGGVNKHTPNILGVENTEMLGINENKLGVKLNKNQIKILGLIENNNKITIIKMAKLLSISETAIENNIKKLREKEILSRIGSDKTGYWEINNNL